MEQTEVGEIGEECAVFDQPENHATDCVDRAYSEEGAVFSAIPTITVNSYDDDSTNYKKHGLSKLHSDDDSRHDKGPHKFGNEAVELVHMEESKTLIDMAQNKNESVKQQQADYLETKEKEVRSNQGKSSSYVPSGFFLFLWSELSRGYVPDENEAVYNVKKERVYAFFSIPKECEKFMFYGVLQCVDSFLFIFTFLPLRLLIIIFKLVLRPWTLCMPHCYLTASQKCDIVKGIIIAIGCILMHQVDASVIYHKIRGQEVIKLYIFFNLLDIGDKLLSSFGQDILDALMWTVADSKRQRTAVLFVHVIASVAYVFIHSMLVLLQASALNVAFNSHNKALLTILISNNAVELKGSVFKKFEKTNLFQMSCSDVRERFHFSVLIFIVCIRNMTDFNWDIAHFEDLIPDILMLQASEVVVDVTKHAFITKFNNISAQVYREYTVLLANDVIESRKKNAFSDVSDQVSRRLGLIPLPLACLLMKILHQSIKIQTPLAVINVILGFLLLIVIKMVVGVIVYGWAVDYWTAYQKEPKSANRKRHKSGTYYFVGSTYIGDNTHVYKGLDQDLLMCENNLHFSKFKPTLEPPKKMEPETISSVKKNS